MRNASLCRNGHLSYSGSPHATAPCGTCGVEQCVGITEEQETAIKRLTEGFGAPSSARLAPFDLPTGYVEVTFGGSFTAGIASNGDTSS